jgi:LmbE family N-acetylglucosaminyl deacetylase
MRLDKLIWCVAAAMAVSATSAVRPQDLPQDRGAAGAWQKLLKLTTTASVMYTDAHPDDEQGGVLAFVSRGQGARTTMLTLNRGEAGDNAIGAELFDALGLVRTEELRVADRYYGIDQQYFTTVVDYGFSKRLDEAIGLWGRDNLLRDMVRVIRTERPWVLVSRWQGNQRDGHGQHQAAGLLTQEAFKGAADPKQFPEQVAEGLRPWQALKLYMGGARENEPWNVRIDPGTYDPVLGDSYANVARLGLSFQRSQNSGRYVPSFGPAPAYFVRLAGRGDGAQKENGFFDGIDASWPGLYRALGRTAPEGASAMLEAIEREVIAAKQAFTLIDPSASAPALARGLAGVRAARTKLAADADVVHVLAFKEQQFADALVAALGIEVSAVAVPAGTAEPSGPSAAFAPVANLPPIVPGQSFDVRVGAASRPKSVTAGFTRWSIQLAGATVGASEMRPAPLAFTQTVTVRVPGDARPTRPHVTRESLAEHRYTSAPGTPPFSPSPDPPVRVSLTAVVNDVAFEVSRPVQRREVQPPYGFSMRDVLIVPEFTVSVSPRQALLSLQKSRPLSVIVEVTNNQPVTGKGTVSIQAPSGWRVEPASIPFELAPAGARAEVTFAATAPAVGAGRYAMTAVATSGGKTFTEGYDVLEHRDLETRYFYRPSIVNVAAVDVAIAADPRVGYVMGVGDELPAALAQLGVKVDLLDASALASAPLGGFDAIMLGTRAYAVRADLRANNARLLEYTRNGGHLIVLYNTQELDPATEAPFPGKLPANAEEVSEEDSTVTILAPDHPLFTYPNRITSADFEGWIEQRGSKFWSEWDHAYTPMLECHDRGQAPQRGGWLYARYGKGQYSYVAYAFHRQLPFGVPGAYRLMANLLSLGRKGPA